MDPHGFLNEDVEEENLLSFSTLRRHARALMISPEEPATSEPVPSLYHTSEEPTYATEPDFDPYEASPHFDHTVQSSEAILCGKTGGILPGF
ncbi:uncharacterized protein N7477_000081 [Penicillium maclennaniae]|uniref:uncharacterized protein n=1 Tax=Penicillium maclennaniae TaxID=1343394 RepID=UPI0025418F46|nr:uncharacterized protein N7477_000081 [Penicillium maclennaniae]KAJ5683736.1 hypothetical protein N7477_000081 [Penicillium maclennaniae]